MKKHGTIKELMRLDGARFGDVHPRLAGVGKVAATTGKVVGVTVISGMLAGLPVILNACGDKPGPGPEQPGDQPADRSGGTSTDLTFGMGLTVNVKGPEGVKYTTAEWNVIRGQAAAAVGRGYGAAGGMAKGGIENYFGTNTVTIELSTTLANRCEVRARVIYFKADGAAMDSITGADMLLMINAVVSGNPGQVASKGKNLDVFLAEHKGLVDKLVAQENGNREKFGKFFGGKEKMS